METGDRKTERRRRQAARAWARKSQNDRLQLPKQGSQAMQRGRSRTMSGRVKCSVGLPRPLSRTIASTAKVASATSVDVSFDRNSSATDGSSVSTMARWAGGTKRREKEEMKADGNLVFFPTPSDCFRIVDCSNRTIADRRSGRSRRNITNRLQLQKAFSKFTHSILDRESDGGAYFLLSA